MRKIILLVIISIFLVTVDSSAGNYISSFHCGTDIVELGDSSYKVKEKCGEPMSRQNVGYDLNSAGQREFAIEEWVYNVSLHRFIIIMTGNRVSRIMEERR